jgi:hypothetical protein
LVSPLKNPLIGPTLPEFVKAGFDAFLEFGIFAQEFLRLRRA